jgi:hypothetical protein
VSAAPKHVAARRRRVARGLLKIAAKVRAIRITKSAGYKIERDTDIMLVSALENIAVIIENSAGILTA